MSDNANSPAHPSLPPSFATLQLQLALDPEPPTFDLSAVGHGMAAFLGEPEPAPELPPLLEEGDGPGKARVRGKTISIKRLSKRELERGRLLNPEVEYDRPGVRGACQHGPHAERPCPWVSCKHHLYLDVNDRTGSIKINFPDLEVWELPETCALDIADRGGITLEEVGEIMNLTRERIRQLETRGLRKLAALPSTSDLSDYL